MSQAEQDEKRRVVLQDHAAKADTATLHQIALNDPVAGGRFSHVAPPTVVKGAKDYPNRAVTWAVEGMLVPAEPPLGFSIDRLD